MEDEIKFTCELCGKSFDAFPDSILECSANFVVIDPDTGKKAKLSQEMREEILSDAAEDPELAPFLKGTICMCSDCQKKFLGEAEEEK